MTNALAVVAHHDDHVLWMDGTIQRTLTAGWKWTIVAMCAPATDRAEYFVRCCKSQGVEPITFDFKDYMEGQLNSLDKMRSTLSSAVQGRTFNVVFTHSRRPDGEYGVHANHFEVRDVVDALVKDGAIAQGPDSVAYFSYQAIYRRSATVARRDANLFVQLNYPELMEKCKWSMEAPDADSNLKNLGYPCPSPEAFDCTGSLLTDLVEPLLL